MDNIKIIRKIVHFIFRSNFKGKCIKNFSRNIKGKKILELGSGKIESGKYKYSVKKFFSSNNEFITSDINKTYGHRIIDITKYNVNEEYDIVLCLNVLEHVFDYKKAIINLFRCLKKGGTLVIIVPVFYPLHDEPHDYWRFTEHSLRKLLTDFQIIKFKFSGMRRYPFSYYIEAIK